MDLELIYWIFNKGLIIDDWNKDIHIAFKPKKNNFPKLSVWRYAFCKIFWLGWDIFRIHSDVSSQNYFIWRCLFMRKGSHFPCDMHIYMSCQFMCRYVEQTFNIVCMYAKVVYKELKTMIYWKLDQQIWLLS